MDKVLRDIVLGLGVFFGMVGTEDPALSMRVFRDDRAIYVNMEIARAFSKDAMKLLETGNELTLSYVVDAKGYAESRVSRSVLLDPIRGVYRVVASESGEEHVMESREVACEIAATVFGFRVLDLKDFDPQRPLEVRASCRLDAKGMDAGVAWNYKVPETRRTFSGLSGIPK